MLEVLEEEMEAGRMEGVEIFFLTNNYVATPVIKIFLVDATVGLLRAEGLFQITHKLSNRDKANSVSTIRIFQGLFDILDILV